MTNITMGGLYKSHKNKIKKYVQKMDAKTGFSRSEQDLEDFVSEFFLNIFEIKKRNNKRYKLIDSYSSLRINPEQKDPLLIFLLGHIKNSYASERNQNIQERETIQNYYKEYESKIGCFHNRSSYEENYSNPILETDYEETQNFCYDIKKLHKTFKQTLKGLEKKAYIYFIDQELSPSIVANKIGVSIRTAYNLRNSINLKAQETMEVYNASWFNNY